jgi:hypothetical protein
LLGIDEIPAELMQAGGNTLCSEIHKLIHSIWNGEELPEKWKKFVIIQIYKEAVNEYNNY